jgi:hypothetical protein
MTDGHGHDDDDVVVFMVHSFMLHGRYREFVEFQMKPPVKPDS